MQRTYNRVALFCGLMYRLISASIESQLYISRCVSMILRAADWSSPLQYTLHTHTHSTQPPSSALNMTLPAFAAEHRGACSTAPATIAGRSAANPPAAVAAVDRWDRQTDGHPTVSQTLLGVLYAGRTSRNYDWPTSGDSTSRSRLPVCGVDSVHSFTVAAELLTTLVWPVSTCESWTLNRYDTRRIEAAEMRGFRQLLRVPSIAKETVSQ